MKRVRSLVCVVSFAVFAQLSGCGTEYPPPAGYVEACYGGDFRANLNGSGAKFTMRVAATEQQWAALAARLKAFGVAHGLAVFDTSMNPAGLRMFEVSLCTSKGLFVFADKRLWADGPPDADPNHVTIIFYKYINSAYDWEHIATDLEASFHDWPGTVESKYPGRLANGT